MLKKSIWLSLASTWLILSSPMLAQQQSDTLLSDGSQVGHELGKQAALLKLLTQPRWPLRSGLLPLLALDETLVTEHMMQAIESEILEHPHLKAIPYTAPNTGIQSNSEIMALASEHRLELIIQAKILQAGQHYWLITTVYAGTNGKILTSDKGQLEQIDAKQIASHIKQSLDTLTQLPAVHDLQTPSTAPLGELHLRTSPEGMQVYVDEVAVGRSPLFVRGLTSGAHLLRITEEIPYQVTRIQIISNPPGMQVKVNGQALKGQTPLDLPSELLGPGTYEIVLEGNVDFEADIQVQTQPAQVPVQLNEFQKQRTPVSFQQLKAGKYQLKILPYSAIEVREPLMIQTQSPTVKTLNAYKYARLILDTSVSNVQIELNQEPLGETPYSVNLAQGLHELQLSKSRYRDQVHSIYLAPGETHQLYYEMLYRSTDTSIFLTPTGELTPQFNLSTKYLTFGNLGPIGQQELAHIYGLEIDYGWPELYKLANTFDLGLELSGFFFAAQNARIWRSYQGLGSKVQFLRESDTMPISAAVGSYFSLGPERSVLVGYISLSRHFGDFALHLGLQTHGFNLNLGYTGWDNLKLGALVYSDSFFRLLAEAGEPSSTFYGLQAGYSF